MDNILVTGCAGFIGFHTTKQLLEEGYDIVGVDMINEYYDPKLKEARLEILKKYPNFKFLKFNIADKNKVDELRGYEFEAIIHLAAQAGVRHSLTNPNIHAEYNVNGTLNMLELARNKKIKRFIFASSSSVYGNNKKQPFAESDPVDHPISFYAVTKKDGELMCHAYHHLFGINIVCLRFFTVYGPYGRPDMAMFIFANGILNNEEIPIFNYGNMTRSFTYITDIVDGIIKSLKSNLKYEIINLGGSDIINLNYLVNLVEKELGKKAKKSLQPLQLGDVLNASADTTKAKQLLNWKSKVNIEDGVKQFIKWYKEYYKVN